MKTFNVEEAERLEEQSLARRIRKSQKTRRKGSHKKAKKAYTTKGVTMRTKGLYLDNIPSDLHSQFKACCAVRGCSMVEVVRAFMEDFVNGKIKHTR